MPLFPLVAEELKDCRHANHPCARRTLAKALDAAAIVQHSHASHITYKRFGKQVACSLLSRTVASNPAQTLCVLNAPDVRVRLLP